MGLSLILLSRWTPKYIIREELENISHQTTTALKALIMKHGAKEVEAVEKEQPPPTSIQEQRTALAKTQARLVEILEATAGHEEAIRLGREALFSVGQDVGKQTRKKLGVSDSPKDLIRAAKILYRILGIEFHLEWLDNSSAKIIIDRCALSEQYSKLTRGKP